MSFWSSYNDLLSLKRTFTNTRYTFFNLLMVHFMFSCCKLFKVVASVKCSECQTCEEWAVSVDTVLMRLTLGGESFDWLLVCYSCLWLVKIYIVETGQCTWGYMFLILKPSVFNVEHQILLNRDLMFEIFVSHLMFDIFMLLVDLQRSKMILMLSCVLGQYINWCKLTSCFGVIRKALQFWSIISSNLQ